MEGQLMETTFGKAKAVWAAVLGFVGPGVAYMTAQVIDGGNGVQGNDWLVAGLLCLGGAVAGGITVYHAENKTTTRPVP